MLRALVCELYFVVFAIKNEKIEIKLSVEAGIHAECKPLGKEAVLVIYIEG